MARHWLNITVEEIEQVREENESGLFEAKKTLLRRKMLEQLANGGCNQDDRDAMLKVLIEHMR